MKRVLMVTMVLIFYSGCSVSVQSEKVPTRVSAEEAINEITCHATIRSLWRTEHFPVGSLTLVHTGIGFEADNDGKLFQILVDGNHNELWQGLHGVFIFRQSSKKEGDSEGICNYEKQKLYDLIEVKRIR